MLTEARQPTRLFHAMGMEDPSKSVLQDTSSLISVSYRISVIFFHSSVPALTLWSLVSFTVLDWLVQPKPRWLGGNGWLLDGPEEVLQGAVHFTVFSMR